MVTPVATPAEEKARVITKILKENRPVNSAEFKLTIEGFKNEIEKALPVHLKENAIKYARQTLTLFQQDPKLQMCLPISIVTAVLKANELGLDLSPQLGQAWILPYKDKSGKMLAQFQIGYRGALTLMHRSGRIKHLAPHIVYEKDHFKYQLGLNPTIEHVPAAGDRGKPTHVYVVVLYVNGGFDFEVWTWEQVNEHARTKSKSFNSYSSPWKSDFESMARKTLILAIWKRQPIEVELQRYLAMDETVTTDLSQMQDGDSIIDAPLDEVEPEPLEVTFTDEEIEAAHAKVQEGVGNNGKRISGNVAQD